VLIGSAARAESQLAWDKRHFAGYDVDRELNGSSSIEVAD
jgi:hypothetical protein